MYSRIVQCTYIQDIDNRDTLLATVTQLHQHADKTCIVLGCTDDYASLLMDIRDELPENCVAPLYHPRAAGQAGFQSGLLRSVRPVSHSPIRKPSAPRRHCRLRN